MGGLRVVGLFAGIGGIELGFHRAGHETSLLCESWEPAQRVLRHRFPGVDLAGDIRALRSLPSKTNVVVAGFPCQDLSQAGRGAGITGQQSGLVENVFRLISRRHPDWLVLENVQFMLQLDRGRAMAYLVEKLEALEYRWAYRVVDSRFTGVPQRRRRVILVASRTHDPRPVVFADDADAPVEDRYRSDAFGFYWTEGLRGLGWAKDAIPTLKGGSTIGIPSSPGIWVPGQQPGSKLVLPSIEDAEALQGFPRGWTDVAGDGLKKGPRWKLVGNAVTVDVAAWVGGRLSQPGSFECEGRSLTNGPWPSAAWGEHGQRWAVDASEYPLLAPYTHLLDLVDAGSADPVSVRGASGFYERTQRAKLRFDKDFLADVVEHIEHGRARERTQVPA